MEHRLSVTGLVVGPRVIAELGLIEPLLLLSEPGLGTKGFLSSKEVWIAAGLGLLF